MNQAIFHGNLNTNEHAVFRHLVGKCFELVSWEWNGYKTLACIRDIETGTEYITPQSDLVIL